MRASRICMAGSIALFLISATIGLAVDSITLLLDASASLVILAVGILMHNAIRQINKPADHTFNFGYGKFEPLTVVIEGLLIITTCVISIKFAIQDIIHPEDISNYYLPAAGSLVLILIAFSVFIYLKREAKQTRSAMLATASLHWLTDAIMSCGIFGGFLLGLLLQEFGYDRITPYVDPVMAILLAIFLVYVPVRVIRRNLLELLDAAPREDLKRSIYRIVDEHTPQAFRVHRVRIRKAGDGVFVDICLVPQCDMTTREIGVVFTELEAALRNHVSNCDVVLSFKFN